MINLNEVTIAFSGFNIRHFAVLAVESFLYYYPELRGNIVYFDDNSSDRTKDDLERRGIKVITWTDKWKNEYMKYKDSDYFISTTQAMSSRVCFIMREIMEQTTTKYLFINDGDVVFKKGGFLEEYLLRFEKGSKIVFHEEPSLYNEKDKQFFVSLDNDVYNYYSKYESIYEEDCTLRKGSELILCSSRVHLLHTILDVEYFKEMNMLGDRLNEHSFKLMHGGLVDTGTDFYHQIRESSVPYSKITDDQMTSVIHHWGWLSSSNRDIDKGNFNSFRNQYEEIKECLELPFMAFILSEINVRPTAILISFQRTQENKKLY